MAISPGNRGGQPSTLSHTLWNYGSGGKWWHLKLVHTAESVNALWLPQSLTSWIRALLHKEYDRKQILRSFKYGWLKVKQTRYYANLHNQGQVVHCFWSWDLGPGLWCFLGTSCFPRWCESSCLGTGAQAVSSRSFRSLPALSWYRRSGCWNHFAAFVRQ